MSAMSASNANPTQSTGPSHDTKAHTVTLFPGDGIGPEITEQVLRVLDALDLPLSYEPYEIGQASVEQGGTLLPEEALASLARNKVALKAPVTTPIGHGFRSVNVALRLHFDLYANLRPARTYPGVEARFDDIDLVIFRENTEDLYVGEEYEESPDVFVAKKRISRAASERIIRRAFDFARAQGRSRVTCVHKANILKQTDGLFLHIFEEIAQDYPEVQADSMIVDNCAMQMVLKPEALDVMVMPNLYGDILSDLASGLIGGLGLMPSANLGAEVAVFEAVHGSAPDIAGQGLANPTALLLSACLMLDHLGYREEGDRVRRAIEATLRVREHCTRDLGGSASTSEYTDHILRNLCEA